jgi:hypothetical protein
MGVDAPVITRLNATVMTVYLWHMVPVILVAVAMYPTGVLPQPAIGSAQWWATRPAWLALLAAVLIPLTLAVMRAERPLLRLPTAIGSPRRWSPALLLLAKAAVMLALARLAIAGFAPGGHLPLLVLVAYAGGLVATLLSGKAPSSAATAATTSGSAAAAGPASPAPRSRLAASTASTTSRPGSGFRARPSRRAPATLSPCELDAAPRDAS